MNTVDEALAFAEMVYPRVSDAGIIASEVRRLREENDHLRETSRIIGELEQLAARSNNDLLVENERLREENERMRVVLESACEKMKQCRYVEARSDMLQAIDAARGAK